MAILKVLGCCFLFLVALFCILLIFFYLREWYAKWRGDGALSKHLGKCEAIQKEMSEIRNEISRTVSECSEEPLDDEWQGYKAQLRKTETEENAALLALVWLFHNHQVEQRRLCPELYKRLDDLQACLVVEDGLVGQLKSIHRPYFMSRINYDYWQEYRKKRSNGVT